MSTVIRANDKSFRLSAIAAAIAVALVPAAVSAQADADPLAAARACSRIDDDSERLACLDAALAGDEVGRDARAAEAAGGEAAREESARAEARMRAEAEARAAAEARAEAAGAAPARAAASEASDAGVEEASSDESEIPVRIVEIRRSRLGTASFVTDDGEILVQRGGVDGRYPPVPFDTVLLPGLRNSYFLVSPLGGPRARVRPSD